MDPVADEWDLRKVEYGYPYLPVNKEDEANASPSAVNRLRDGRFYGRYATVFDHSGQRFSIILTVDGKRRTLDSYKQLGRQKSSGCGIPLSSQRGVILTSHGVRVCPYNDLFREDALSEYDVLAGDTEHYLLFIDGPFELTTNRNAPAPDSLKLLKEAGFLEKIKAFLTDVFAGRPRGVIFKELVARLSDERTHEREEQYLKIMERARTSLPGRRQFVLEDVPALKDKWFVEPGLGEENMVGALFTLFAHVVPKDSPAAYLWKRPLTFSAYGIDAIASTDEKNLRESLEYLEYKHTFSADIEFNHPFSITNEIVCWDFPNIPVGAKVSDNHDYIAIVGGEIEYDGKKIGLVLDDIRKRSGLQSIGRTIRVLSLKRLMAATFKLLHRAPIEAEKAATNA